MLIAAPAAVVLVAAVAVTMAWVTARDDQRDSPIARLVALVAIVAVATSALAALIWSSGFVWDDIKNLRQAQLEALSVPHLLESTSGHFAPGHRLADWLFARSFGFDFAPAAVILVIAFVLTLLVFHRLLAELFGAGLGPLVLTLVYAVAIAHVGVGQWWASGVDRLPATFFTFLSMLLYVRWFRTRAWSYVAGSVAALAVAELFYVKPVLVPLYLVLLRVLVLEPQRPWRETLAAAGREWRVWIPYAVVSGLFAVVYLRAYPLDLNESLSFPVLLEYAGIVWFRVLVPNLFGIWVPKDNVPAVAWLGVVAAQVLFAGLVAWSIARWRPAWRAWTFFAAGAAVNILMVGATRIGFFGPKLIAYTVYFNLEATFLFVLALGAAVLGPRTAGSRPSDILRSLRLPVVRAVAVAGLAAYMGLCWWGGYQISQPEFWVGARSRAYLDVATEQLRQLGDAGAGVVLVDGVVPDDVVPYVLVPYNSASEVFPLIDDRVDFDATLPELFHIGPDGRARPVTFVSDYGGDIVTLLSRQLVGVLSATPRLVGDALCITTEDEPATIGVAPAPSIAGEDLAVRLEFDTPRPTELSLLVNPRPVITEGPAEGRTKFRVVNVDAGVHSRVFALDAPVVESLFIVVEPRSEFCVYRLEVGRLVDRQP